MRSLRMGFHDAGELTLHAERPMPQGDAGYAAALRRELSARAITWAQTTGAAHEETIGQSPTVLFREDADGRHGNFFAPAYKRLCSKPEWKRRLSKVHTSARTCLVSHDTDRSELDTATSSDALLMSIFCCPQHPRSRDALYRLLCIGADSTLRFGHKPRIPLKNRGIDCTEVDLWIGDLYIEAKLTEANFQSAPLSRIERYLDADHVFDLDALPKIGDRFNSYQLIRGALAAYAESERRYCVICDARRPDLIDAWFSVMRAVKPFDLKSRLQLVTWQELSAALSKTLQAWLGAKYGIFPASAD